MIASHRDLIVDIVSRNGYTKGIEVGLGGARLFRMLLESTPGLHMIGVDLGLRDDRRLMQKKCVDDHLERAKVYWTDSVSAAKEIPDGWADFVFIDAAHSYEAVKADIAAYESKVRPGGWFGGHDYHHAFPGVIMAVDDRYGAPMLHDFAVWEWPHTFYA